MSALDRPAVNLRNVLTLLGIIITTAGMIYFAVEFVDVISEWGRVVSLILLAVVFIALGVHFEQTGGDEIATQRGWARLRVNTALYILGAVSSFAAVVAFFAVDDLDRLYKVAATIVLGLGLILAAARRMRPHA